MLDDLDGVELIGRYVSLKPAHDDGSRLTGRCPFCRHGADSLLVDARDDSYFCTDCLEGGHALDFYAHMEGLSLSESVWQVTGLMTSGELQGKRPRQKRFQCIIDETNRFAREALVHSREGGAALTWLDRQGVTPTTVEAFALGLLSCGLGKQLLERLRTMGFSSDELEQAGIDGWLSCKEDQVRNGEPDATILMPVRDQEGHCWGFYEQSIEAEVMRPSSFSPYGFRLLSPHRAERLVFSASKGQDSVQSVVLVERPWDVVLLARWNVARTVYIGPLDPDENRHRLERLLARTKRAVWPIHSSDLSVGFVRSLARLSFQAVDRLAFVVLPEGERFPGWVRRQGLINGQARFDDALLATGLLGL